MCTRSPLGLGHDAFVVVAIRVWPRVNFRVIEPWTEFIGSASSAGVSSITLNDICGGIVRLVREGVRFRIFFSNNDSIGASISMAIRDREGGCLAGVRSFVLERITLHHTPRTTLTVQRGRRLSPHCTMYDPDVQS